ncbi:serum paraoxonase/arylesterase 2-like isoform X2 [Xyrauchen texanus]|uniref:serum paraoxonase/arylesterase 2-like isoform X2 n=1 Tax=Xyrauchen texanus TaxID=154827 RepID=UPI0022429220|nr:serum paraoxonase/arylesterase 2-like isoform X2 [Xyrauchen texanus]
MGKLTVLSLFVVALSALIGERLIAIRHVALSSRELTQNHLPNCYIIKGIEFGAEDISILEGGLAFLSTGLKYPGLPSYSEDPGKLYTLNLVDSPMNIEALSIKGEFDKDSFNPHGISLYTDDKDGAIYLFVVNHPRGKSHVEIFRFVEKENSLQYIKTIRHELLHNVNDIVAVGAESFYAANDHYFTNGILKFLEPLLSLAWCDVIYYSPDTVQVVAEGFMSANGINISPNKRQLKWGHFVTTLRWTVNLVIYGWAATQMVTNSCVVIQMIHLALRLSRFKTSSLKSHRWFRYMQMMVV